MKVCGLVAEYNPLHNGHLKHIEYIKNTLNAEKIIVVMSGDFTQRGEPAIMNKYQRAKQAIIAGADCVIELPTVFATANAEVFCKNAVKILNSLGAVDGICFGVESGEKDDYIKLANILANESKDFKRALKAELDNGNSLIKARINALKTTGVDNGLIDLLAKPNNILGIEYAKAILSIGSKMEIYPMLREGDHNDLTLKSGITSASSIRNSLKVKKSRKLKKVLPPFVFSEISGYPIEFDKLIYAKLITASTEKLRGILDCNEGLENRIKALSVDAENLEDLVNKVTTKRYTSARIRRILLSNFLDIEKDFVLGYPDKELYARVLAVNKDKKDVISLISKTSKIPVITRKTDTVKLSDTQKKCYEIDCTANALYNLAKNQKENPHQLLLV